jgi:RNA polymerase sigma-70 factor, ECF subfamily
VNIIDRADDTLNDAALRSLYPRLRRFAAVVAPAEIGPDDLVQEALVRLLDRGTTDVENVEAFARRTMLRLASNHRRQLGRRRRAITRLGSQRAITEAAAAYPSDIRFLEQLSPVARAVLFLHEVDDLEFAEVARQLDLSESAVKQTAARARRQLRNHLNQELS